MGCCGSTQAGDNERPPAAAAAQPSPPPGSAQPPTTSLISPVSPIPSNTSRTPAPRSLQIISTSHSQSQSASRSSTPGGAPSSSSIHTPRLHLASHERYNAPLVPPHPWTSTSRTWTPPQLHRERHDFFDTRVTGRPEIWGALQNVCELVRGGDMVTAQGILDAAAVTLPTGNLVDGCYDEVGNLYRLPEVVVNDPLNIIERGDDGEDVRPDRSRDGSNNNIDGDTMIGVPVSKGAVGHEEKVLDGGAESGVEREDTEMLERRREDKGKASARDAVRVRCRLSDRGGPDVVIMLGKTEHVAALARRVQAEGNVSPTLRIRLAYLGKILNEKDTLEAQGWIEGHVLNALVVGGVVAEPTTTTTSKAEKKTAGSS